MDFNITFPFTKVDKEKRLVTGIATADNIDSEDDLIDFGGSLEAFNNWPGNIREMHQPTAVGKMVHFTPVVVTDDNGGTYDGLETTVYVSKGAQDTWEKVLDGTLQGFSVGGGIIEAAYEFDKSKDKSYRRIKKYEMVELSLVDNPANPLSKFTMVKMANAGEEIEGFDHQIQNESLGNLFYKGTDVRDIHAVYYCSKDGIAKTDDNQCSEHGQMIEIGFVEDFDKAQIKKMIASYENTHNGGENDKEVLPYNGNNDIVKSMSTLDEKEKETLLDKFKKFLDSDEKAEGDGSGLFTHVINVNVPAPVTEPVAIEKSAADKVDEVDDETQNDGGDDNVETEQLVEKVSELLQKGFEEFTKTVDEKIDAVKEELGSSLAEVTKTVETQQEEITKFAESGAIQKSADDDDVDDNVDDENLEKSSSSVWSGLFVPDAVSKQLGYNS